MTLVLIILEINDDGDDNDSLSDSDFYVAGHWTDGSANKDFNNESSRIEGEENIRPGGWEFWFDASSSAGSATLDLRVLDYDSGLNFGDDETVNATMSIQFRPCEITGSGVSVGCGWDASISQGDTVKFRIQVNLPPSSPGLNIRCLQDPLLPQPGQAVTITAETLDGTALSTKIVDDLVIEVNNTEVVRRNGVTQATYTFTPSDSWFRMRCYAENTPPGGQLEQADTWTRDVRVGTINELAAMVAKVGSSARHIDIVAMPDWDAYTGGWMDPAFQQDLHDSIWDGYYANAFVLGVQNRLNIWVAQRSADIDGTAASCDSITPPEDWDNFSFADSGWIFHDDAHRNCADPAMRIFGSDTSDATTAVHETGHTPFGLADEYCTGPAGMPGCDGGYFQDLLFPNVYAGVDACIADAPSIGAPSSDCRVITGDWYTSDPGPDDVMNTGQRTFNRLDVRRWRWLLDLCANTPEGC